MKEELIEKAIEIFGLTNDCNIGGYILPSGELLNIEYKDSGTRDDHSIVRELYAKDTEWEDSITRTFVKETGAIRLHHMPNSTFIEFSEKHKPTFEQLGALRVCACKQGLEPHRIVYDIYEKNDSFRSGEVSGGFRDMACDKVINRFINIVIDKMT